MADRLYVVGDVHGCARELEALRAALRVAPGDTLAFIGVYIDRGPHSRAVVDRIAARGRPDGPPTVLPEGNRRWMWLGYLDRGGQWGEAWRGNGGAATLRSYGIPADVSGARAADAFPPGHVEF